MGPAAKPGLAALAGALRSGALSPEARVAELLDLVEREEPGILALLPEPDRRGRLLAEARELARRWPEPASRPPLYGLLLGVKDLFNAEGFETRAGSRLPPALFAGPEAASVAVLKAAGALVLGKTVSTEFAYFAPGPTRNPRDRERSPGGSSSGSAAAVAAGFADLALGTQTIGSIGRPAAYCGVAGLKPSYERVSREGVVPFSPSLDHIGLFAAEAEGLALGASVLLPGWRSDAFEGAREGGRPLALAVPEGPYLAQAEPSSLAAFERALEALAALGCRVTRVAALGDIERINERHRRIAAAELARVHRDWYPRHRELYAPATAELIEKGLLVGEAELAADLAGRFSLRAALEEGLREAGAQLWVSPAAPGAAPLGLASTGSPLMNLPWTHAGLPTLVVPAGLSPEGMPLGLQLAAPFGADEELMGAGWRIAAALG